MQYGSCCNTEVLGSLIVRPVAHNSFIIRSVDETRSNDIHLSPSEDQPLLLWGDARLLLYFLFDSCNLIMSQILSPLHFDLEEVSTYLVIRIYIEFDLWKIIHGIQLTSVACLHDHRESLKYLFSR